MSFQAYLDNIQAKTGRTPDDFRRIAAEKGFTVGGVLRKDIKAGVVLAWLAEDYDLGRGHGMAIVALLKGDKKVGDA